MFASVFVIVNTNHSLDSSKRSFKIPLLWLVVVGEFPYGMHWTHGLNRSDDKSIMDFFLSCVHLQEFSIPLHFLNWYRPKGF